MKKIGSLLFCFALIVLFGVVMFQFIGTNKNNPGDTISIAKARDLVNMVYSACKGDDADSLSTAAVEDYEYDYVRPIDAGGSSYLQVLFTAKCALEDYDTTSGAFMSSEPDMGLYIHTIYELTENGVIMDFLFGVEDVSTATSRMILEMYYLDDFDNSWGMIYTITDIKNEIENFDHANDSKNFVQYTLFGKEEKIMRIEMNNVYVNESFYGNILTRDNVISVYSQRIDSTEHEQEIKIFGQDNDGSFGTYTNDELDTLVAYVQNYCKNAYSPKFYGVEFTETDYATKFVEEFPAA